MRSKDDINKDLFDHNNWSDRDGSRKAHQTDILIEVLIDIRDIHSRILDTFIRIFGYIQKHN